MRAGGLPRPDHRARLVGDLHPRGTRGAALGIAQRVVAYPDRVGSADLSFAPVLARID